MSIQQPLATVSHLARFGITDTSKIALQSFHSAVQVEKRGVTFRETTSVYFDDHEAQQRIVLTFKVDTRELRKKREPVLHGVPSCRVTVLKGYNMAIRCWGSVSHEEQSIDLSVGEAWATHLECQQLRAHMHAYGSTWYAEPLKHSY